MNRCDLWTRWKIYAIFQRFSSRITMSLAIRFISEVALIDTPTHASSNERISFMPSPTIITSFDSFSRNFFKNSRFYFESQSPIKFVLEIPKCDPTSVTVFYASPLKI